MEKIIDGKKVNVEIMGGFEIEELKKSYALCSYDDEAVVIMEIEKNGNEIVIKSIPDDEKEMVVLFYQSLKKEMLGDDL
jgi:hypothetical protein